MKKDIKKIINDNMDCDFVDVENMANKIIEMYNPIITEKIRLAIIKFTLMVNEKGLNFTVIDVDNYIKNVVDKEINNNASTYL